MKKVRINVSGMVQGVGFRYMTKIVADRMRIYGTVKNEANGSVSITAFGPDERIEAFIKKIEDSPSPAGKVTSLQIEVDDTLPEYHSFDIIH